MWALRKLRLWFIWRRPVTWSLCHSVAGTQRRKQTALKHETFLTRKTQPRTNWRVFWQSTTLLSSSSKAPGKATGSVSDRTHVRSVARRKSKWTIGGCGALRRCGCARTYEGTKFLCVKFRLGSAGEPTICSHCYHVLNEDLVLTFMDLFQLVQIGTLFASSMVNWCGMYDILIIMVVLQPRNYTNYSD